MCSSSGGSYIHPLSNHNVSYASAMNPNLPQALRGLLLLGLLTIASVAQAEIQTLTVLGANGTVGEEDLYAEASTDGGTTWAPLTSRVLTHGDTSPAPTVGSASIPITR